MAIAYSWNCYTPEMPDDEILLRPRALNLDTGTRQPARCPSKVAT